MRSYFCFFSRPRLFYRRLRRPVCTRLNNKVFKILVSPRSRYIYTGTALDCVCRHVSSPRYGEDSKWTSRDHPSKHKYTWYTRSLSWGFPGVIKTGPKSNTIYPCSSTIYRTVDSSTLYRTILAPIYRAVAPSTCTAASSTVQHHPLPCSSTFCRTAAPFTIPYHPLPYSSSNLYRAVPPLAVQYVAPFTVQQHPLPYSSTLCRTVPPFTVK